MTEPSAETDDDYSKSVERDAALVQEALGPFGTIIENIKSIFLSKIGIAILAILILLLIVLRFRKEPVETIDIEPINDAELAEIEKEVSGLMDDAAATQTSENIISSEEETIIAPQKSLDSETLSDDEDKTSFDADPSKFMDEVNTYIAFEQFEEAEKSVRSAIVKDQSNEELHLKLLEVFYTAGNRENYEEVAKTVNEKFGKESETWDKTVTMWEEMTSSPLSISDDGSEDETMVVGAVDDGSEDETMVVGAVDDGSEDETIVVGAVDDDSGVDVELPSSDAEDDFEIDLSVSEDEEVDSNDIVIDDKETDELEKTEFDLEIGDLEIGDLGSSDDNEIFSTEETSKEDDDEGIELEISLDDDENIPNENNPKEDTHADFVEQVAQSEDLTTEDVIATKLDLAKAYVEVSDNDNAKTILDEVLTEGNEEQRKQAQTLLDQI